MPAPEDGVIGEIKVKVGDKVSQGDLLATYRAEERRSRQRRRRRQSGARRPTPKAAASRSRSPLPRPPRPQAAAEARCRPRRTGRFRIRLLVLGAGPGGYTAAFRAADLGQNVVLVDTRPTLGGVCLNVGCIPSKALLHVAKVIDEAKAMGAHGVSFGAPTFDLAAMRGWKDGVVKRLTGGLTGLAKQRKVRR